MTCGSYCGRKVSCGSGPLRHTLRLRRKLWLSKLKACCCALSQTLLHLIVHTRHSSAYSPGDASGCQKRLKHATARSGNQGGCASCKPCETHAAQAELWQLTYRSGRAMRSPSRRLQSSGVRRAELPKSPLIGYPFSPGMQLDLYSPADCHGLLSSGQCILYLKDSALSGCSGRSTSERGVLDLQVINLLRFGCIPVGVLDGQAPEAKLATLQAR